MDIRNKLNDEKTKLLKQIAELAQQGKSQEVLVVGEKLNKIESLIKRYERLLQDISNLETEPQQNNRKVSKLIKDNIIKKLNAVPGRGIGKTMRMEFLKKASERDIYLENIRGSIYETQSGSKVGIAVATERKPDRWFLGLPFGGFDLAVLLCKHEVGTTVEIFLPKKFFDEYGDMMSQSGGQMKFNIARRGRGYVILVPGTDGVSVSKYIESFSLLA